MDQSQIIEHMESHLEELRIGFYDFLGPDSVSELAKYYREALSFFCNPSLIDNMSPEALEARYYSIVNEANDRLAELIT